MAKYTVDEIKKLKSNSDTERLKNMTDEEIHQAALDDPDCVVTSEEDLKKFKRVIHRGGGVYGHDKNKDT